MEQKIRTDAGHKRCSESYALQARKNRSMDLPHFSSLRIYSVISKPKRLSLYVGFDHLDIRTLLLHRIAKVTLMPVPLTSPRAQWRFPLALNETADFAPRRLDAIRYISTSIL
jgi:hypothetical protein